MKKHTHSFWQRLSTLLFPAKEHSYPLGQRVLALLLCALCLAGLVPVQTFAETDVPSTITLKKADYPTGASGGLETYQAPNGLNTVTLHNFRITTEDGQEVTGFCGNHSMAMGNRWNGQEWDSPAVVSDNVYPLLAFYYHMCATDESFEGGERGWANQVTNSYIQCVIWLDKARRLPDYRTDRAGWIADVAEQRAAAYAHYGLEDDPSWTHEMDAAARIDQYLAGLYGTGWKFYEYYYAGPQIGDSTPQPIIIGLNSQTEDTYRIKKVDTNGNQVSGVIFRVEKKDGTFSTTVTTDASGIAMFETTAGGGWYTVTEISAPSGYVLNTSPVDAYLATDSTAVINLVNTEITGEKLKIRKVDVDDPTKGIAGAVIKLTHPTSGLTTTVTSGADGWAVIPTEFIDRMYTGLWEAEEITPPKGYLLNSDPNITKQTFIWDGGMTPISLYFTNDSTVQLRFRKVDENGNGLAGAVVAVYKDGEPLTVATTDASGYITISGISEGFFSFEELTPPAGYAKDVTPYAGIHVDAGQISGGGTVDVTMVNHKKPELTIRKVDAETGDGVGNTVFAVVGVDNAMNTTVTTDSDGWAATGAIDPGTYIVTEQSVPAPYILDTNNSEVVALRAGEARTLTFRNGKEPGLRLIKKDAVTDAPVEGVTFRIEKIDGTFTTELTTDASGEVFCEHLATGAYRVQEIAVPGDYLLNDEVKTVSLVA
nr:hypothetical protein [Oscillospiraceae bacterium]